MTELEKRDDGLWYDANFDPDLIAARTRADLLCWKFNQLAPNDAEGQRAVLDELLPYRGAQIEILQPLYVDYGGDRTTIGDGCFINHGAYLMDGGGITIGNHVFIGPNFGAYTANHPLLPEQRNQGLEIALPIVVEDDVWLGANVTVLPGVTIGRGSVVGAGSVVTKDVPAGVVAVGNPCRVLRAIAEADRVPEGMRAAA